MSCKHECTKSAGLSARKVIDQLLCRECTPPGQDREGDREEEFKEVLEETRGSDSAFTRDDYEVLCGVLAEEPGSHHDSPHSASTRSWVVVFLGHVADQRRELRRGFREIRSRRGQESRDNLRKLLEEIGGQDAVEELLEHYRKESSDQRQRSSRLRQDLEIMKEKVTRSYNFSFWMSVICFGIGVVLVLGGLVVAWCVSGFQQKLAASGIGVGLGTPALIIPLLVGSTKRLQAACNSLVRGQMASHVFATQML